MHEGDENKAKKSFSRNLGVKSLSVVLDPQNDSDVNSNPDT